MGLRFRRSIRIAPGIRMNFGLKSLSISARVRGLKYTTGTRGRRITVGLPGSGLYWTNSLPRSGLGLGIAAGAIIGGAIAASAYPYYGYGYRSAYYGYGYPAYYSYGYPAYRVAYASPSWGYGYYPRRAYYGLRVCA